MLNVADVFLIEVYNGSPELSKDSCKGDADISSISIAEPAKPSSYMSTSTVYVCPVAAL